VTEEKEFMLRLCFFDCEALKIITDIVKRKGMMVAEIGSWCGNSTVIIANKIMPYEGTLFAIDHWSQLLTAKAVSLPPEEASEPVD